MLPMDLVWPPDVQTLHVTLVNFCLIYYSAVVKRMDINCERRSVVFSDDCDRMISVLLNFVGILISISMKQF
jgi:hypothetical protein